MNRGRGGDSLNKKFSAIALTILIAVSVGAVFAIGNAGSVTDSRNDPLSKYRFRVEIDGIVTAGFMEVEGLNVTIEVIEYREGNDPAMAPSLIPGLVHYGPLVLRKGITTNTELWEWIEQVISGNMGSARRNLSVIIQDRNGNDIARYNLSEAWPSSYSVGKLDSLGSGTAIEELVIQYEQLELETD